MTTKMYFVAALALAAAPCFASTIAVTNFSFETLPAGGLPLGCGAGCAYSVGGVIPGWTTNSTGQIGQIQPNGLMALDDGATTAWSDVAGSVISQTVGGTVVLGETYTLLVDIGFRIQPLLGFTGTADLLINGIHYVATGTAPARGAWATYTATYTGLAADVGRTITIDLNSSGGEANFDNVRLDGNLAGVPEPASFLLIAPALVALGFRIKRTARP